MYKFEPVMIRLYSNLAASSSIGFSILYSWCGMPVVQAAELSHSSHTKLNPTVSVKQPGISFSQKMPAQLSQALPPPQQVLPPPQDVIQPPRPELPDVELPADFDPILPPSPPSDGLSQIELPANILEQIPEAFAINSIVFDGNTAFSDQQLLDVLKGAIEQDQLFTATGNVTDLLRIVTVINNHYEEAGYLTTGALLPIPPEDGFPDGQVTITVVEGRVIDIQVDGVQRLQTRYVRSRLSLGARTPLQQDRLVDALQLLQEDPLIESIQATLAAGSKLGTNILQVNVQEAPSLQAGLSIDNVRTPNVGTVQTGLSFSEGNLSGLGDRISFTYNRTEGSDGFSLGYQLPLNAKGGSLNLNYSQTESEIIEPSIASLGITSDSNYWDLTWRQPLTRTSRQEFAIGVTGSYRDSQVVFGEDIFGQALPFPTPGADDEGKTKLTALRFFQEWTTRSQTEAIALRSQFSLGLDALGSTINASGPDSRFFSWRGQAQWRRRLWSDAFLLVGADMQLADGSLLPVEQFTLGGLGTVRGYRQDLLLADNGIAAKAELWIPVARVPEPDINGVLHVIPFLDLGTVWNSGGGANPDPNTLVSTGLGLRWQQEHFSLGLDWGIPLTSVSDQGNSLQENGIYFSLRLSRL